MEDTRVPAGELESASLLLFVERSMGRLPSAGGSSAASWEGFGFTCVSRTKHERPTSAANQVTSQRSERCLTSACCSFWSSELKSSVRSASASESLLTPQRKVGGSCRRRALCSSAAVGFFSHTSVHSESANTLTLSADNPRQTSSLRYKFCNHTLEIRSSSKRKCF